ncbi:hypothetical protein D9615_003507 [Tricholomella constricta]|uniref:Uncharacterized protein n=1 Tax=Tricholomella constricta TaxID=117010 RepID=A0A8H5HIH6_9AGAR|nr:hypothetical protein D9615_003507 [Tricholomella constricta]
MGLLPFSLSYLMLTPRRIQLPTDVVPQSTRSRLRASSAPASPNRWSKHLTLTAKSLRSFQGLSPPAAGKAPADELGVAQE